MFINFNFDRRMLQKLISMNLIVHQGILIGGNTIEFLEKMLRNICMQYLKYCFLFIISIFFLKIEIFRKIIKYYFRLNAKNIFIEFITNYEFMFTYSSINFYDIFYFLILYNLTFN